MLIPSQPYLAWNVDRLIVAPGAALNWISNVIGLRSARETLGCFTVITGAPDAGRAGDCLTCEAALSRVSSSGVTSGHAMAHASGRTDNAKAKVAIASLLFIGIFERSTRGLALDLLRRGLVRSASGRGNRCIAADGAR